MSPCSGSELEYDSTIAFVTVFLRTVQKNYLHGNSDWQPCLCINCSVEVMWLRLTVREHVTAIVVQANRLRHAFSLHTVLAKKVTLILGTIDQTTWRLVALLSVSWRIRFCFHCIWLQCTWKIIYDKIAFTEWKLLQIVTKSSGRTLSTQRQLCKRRAKSGETQTEVRSASVWSQDALNVCKQ